MAAKHVHDALGRAYDAWFGSRTPVTGTQFWGLLLLGGTLIAGGLTVLLTVLSKYPLATFTLSLRGGRVFPGSYTTPANGLTG